MRRSWARWLCYVWIPGSCLAVRVESQATDAGCGEGRSPLMIVGTYHMANQHKDAVNLNADDVLSERRQREIDTLVAKLARFRPTVVAVEAPYADSTIAVRYREYRAGHYTLGRNEIDQVAFRLAGRLNLPTVSAVDYPMYMSGLTPAEVAPRPNRADSGKAPEPAVLSHGDSLLRASTVIAYFRRLNTDSAARADHSGYFDMLLPDTGNAGLYHGADLITNWYKRNLRIFTNLNRVVTFGRDRVMLLIGGGHLTILDQFADAAPYYCRVETGKFLQ